MYCTTTADDNPRSHTIPLQRRGWIYGYGYPPKSPYQYLNMSNFAFYMIPKFWAIPISLYIKDNPDNSKSSVVTISSWYIVYSLKNISSTFNLSLVPVLLKSWISERCLYNAIENDSSKVKPRKVKDYILYSIWIIMLFLNMHKYCIYIYYTCYNILYVNSSSWIQEFQNSKHQTNQVRQAIDCSPWTSSTIGSTGGRSSTSIKKVLVRYDKNMLPIYLLYIWRYLE